eukprot:TRINITY_DN2475_c2_g2_i1.p1 TRINITY_DN2475_c2_g2~~TRINITY_DN2475_c2_g2_i1.p1  ORF type:complete len:196 (+),score=42.79 TRINITY_DN2475_c2_g2_i1:74-661(+)
MSDKEDASGSELPPWLTVDAKLEYVSRSSGKIMEVKCGYISQSKKLVTIVFANDPNSKMHIAFSQILSEKSPLRPGKELDPDEFFENMEGGWKDTAEVSKSKFAFSGPCAPPCMEILSSPEPEVEVAESKSHKSKDKKESKSTGKEKVKEKEKEKKEKKEKDREKEKEKAKDKNRRRSRSRSRSGSSPPRKSRRS